MNGCVRLVGLSGIKVGFWFLHFSATKQCKRFSSVLEVSWCKMLPFQICYGNLCLVNFYKKSARDSNM